MEIIHQKIARIREHLKLIRSIENECNARFHTDPIYRGALLHYLYLTSDSCISLAEMLIRHLGLRPPQSYSDSIDVLGEAGVLEADFAYRFAQIAGFRNFLAHDYEKVDKDIICNAILPGLVDVDEYLEQVIKVLN